jgi:proliferating cell nuclear antigen PCNA
MLLAKTSTGLALKGMIETLKNISGHANMVFSCSGLKITVTDPQELCVVFLTLDAPYFDTYSCASQLTLGIDLEVLHKCVRGARQTSLISFVAETPQELVIRVENELRGISVEHRVELQKISSEQWEIMENVELEFDCIPPEIESSELQTMCRHFVAIGAKEVQVVHQVGPDFDVLRFSNLGGALKSTYSINILPAEGETGKPLPKSVTGRFLLSFLKQFTVSASALNTKIRLSLRQENCLLLEYILPGNTSSLRFLLFQVDQS